MSLLFLLSKALLLFITPLYSSRILGREEVLACNLKPSLQDLPAFYVLCPFLGAKKRPKIIGGVTKMQPSDAGHKTAMKKVKGKGLTLKR